MLVWGGQSQPHYAAAPILTSGGGDVKIETKGLEDTNVANKDRAANLWCANAAQLTGTMWRFVKVAQVDFSGLAGRTLADLAQAFGRR